MIRIGLADHGPDGALGGPVGLRDGRAVGLVLDVDAAEAGQDLAAGGVRRGLGDAGGRGPVESAQDASSSASLRSRWNG